MTIPSELGYEKLVIASAAAIAQKIGFLTERIEDLKTAVGEACINAIEHGNSLNADTLVQITFTCGLTDICVCVIDNGHKPIPTALPNRPEDTTRGWGLFLIQNLMDKVELAHLPDGRNEIRLTAVRTL